MQNFLSVELKEAVSHPGPYSTELSHGFSGLRLRKHVNGSSVSSM